MFKTGCAFGFIFILGLSGSVAEAQDVPGLVGSSAAGPQANPMQGNSNRASYSNPFGMVPKFTPDFWNAASASRIGMGTILTGILDDTISSKHSKPGDLFTIRLQDGFVVNGQEVIPRQSKIIGSVISATSAHGLRNGQPGQVNVSLQTLVFPDGRHITFYGNIDHNPAQDLKNKPGHAPVDIANTGRRTVSSLLTLVTGRAGMAIRTSPKGDELEIPKGIAVPVRVSRPIELTQMIPVPQTVQTPYGQAPGSMPPGHYATSRTDAPGHVSSGGAFT